MSFDDDTSRNAVSRFIASNNRFRIDVGTRERGRGKVRCPVIYLGLKRLIPLAQESEDSIKTLLDNKLTDEDKGLYQEWHNRVLVLDDDVAPQHIKSRNKDLYYPVCDKYDAFGNSAGQDNLAQIILAILSFKRLKEECGNEYSGGVLLIDEVETTLYPAAQHALMDLLLRAAGNYDIQIIFTTHSTDIIGYMLDSKARAFYDSTEIVYLHKPRGVIEICQDKGELPGLIADLKHAVQEPSKARKVNVYFEDEEARLFFKGIVTSDIKSALKISKFNQGGEFYATLLEGKFTEFRTSLIIFDGDKSTNARLKRNKSVLFLPGLVRPENVLYEYLCGLPEDDEFWESRIGGYNKQVFLRNQPTNTTDRATMKRWFNDEKRYWGIGCRKLLRRWKKDHQGAVNRFCGELKNKIERLNIHE